MSASTHSFPARLQNYTEWVENVSPGLIFSPFICRLVGSYGSLKGGNISEGMEDFTGGIAYSIQVSSRTPRVLWRSLTAALARGSLLSCFIQVRAHTSKCPHCTHSQIETHSTFVSLCSKAMSYQEVGQVTGNGLIKGHAYAITDTEKASIIQSVAGCETMSSFYYVHLPLWLCQFFLSKICFSTKKFP